MPKTKSKHIYCRSYKHMLPANKGKQTWLREGMFKDYNEVANILSEKLNKDFLNYLMGNGDEPLPMLKVPSDLRDKYTATITQQAYANSVYPMIISKLGLVTNDIRDEISKLEASENIKKSLYYINRCKMWFSLSALTQEHTKWLQNQLQECWSKRSAPTFNGDIALIDQRNCKLQDSKTSKGYSQWLRLTHKGKGINAPIEANKYADSNQGKLGGLYSLRYNKDKDRTEVTLVKRRDFSASQIPQDKELNLGVDFGLKNLLTTETGNKYGAGLYDYMIKLDKKIQHIASQCQKRKFKLSKSKRYMDSVQKLRATIDRVVNESLNQIMYKEQPTMIIVEKLDFRNSNLSRRLNRLISNSGRAAITKKLTSMQQEYGVDFMEVNPAYTSQECSECHYVDEKNRPNRDLFECLWCGHKDCADTNAARSTGGRRSLPSWYVNAHRKVVLKELVSKFMGSIADRNGVLASSTKQTDVLRSNPYFGEYIGAEVTSTVAGSV